MSEAVRALPVDQLLARLARLRERHGVRLALFHLVDAELDRLPMPGGGRTLERWRVLSEVAALDLSLAKLFEGHTDALAIGHELGAAAAPPGSRWGTWCAEPPAARVHLEGTAEARLTGTKAWCSGAAEVTHAVVSCWDADGRPRLAMVVVEGPTVSVTRDGWQAVGMAASGSVDVRFDGARAVRLGRPGDYVARPGFWQGGAGIAACWFGGALGIARLTRQCCSQSADPHQLAHLGAIDVALASASAVLREAAHWIDEHPREDARRVALQARLAVEGATVEVMHQAGRAVGAGPLCRDARFARAMADLPVFLRQSHGQRDLAALGETLIDPEARPWQL